MSADDATARRLDEQVDQLLATGGGLPLELADDELARVAHLFVVDAAAIGEMPDAAGVRRRLLEQVVDEQQRGWRARRAARARARHGWRARRVLAITACTVVACSAVAWGDQSTPAGRAVRVAARTLNLPVPAEPPSAARVSPREQQRPADASPVDAPASDGAQPPASPQPQRDPDATRTPPADGEPLSRPPVRDGQPGDEPPMLDGEPIGDGQLPPPPGPKSGPDGQLPPPDGMQPGGEPQPMPEPGPGPGPGPAPMPGATAPAPCCEQPPLEPK